MAKVFGVLLIVLGVWLGLEIYTKGMHDAFGGAFARFAEPIRPDAAPGEPVSLPRRVGAKVQRELGDAAQRRLGAENEGN